MERDIPNLSPQEVQQRETLRAESSGDDQERQFAIEAARLLNEFDCEDVLVLDVRGLSDLTNYLVLATGTSDRQIRSLGGRVKDLADESGHEVFGHERDKAEDTTWVVLDFVDVVVHLFDPTARAHYDLEMLWGDAERVKWRNPRRPGQKPEPAGDEASSDEATPDAPTDEASSDESTSDASSSDDT